MHRVHAADKVVYYPMEKTAYCAEGRPDSVIKKIASSQVQAGYNIMDLIYLSEVYIYPRTYMPSFFVFVKTNSIVHRYPVPFISVFVDLKACVNYLGFLFPA